MLNRFSHIIMAIMALTIVFLLGMLCAQRMPLPSAYAEDKKPRVEVENPVVSVIPLHTDNLNGNTTVTEILMIHANGECHEYAVLSTEVRRQF